MNQIQLNDLYDYQNRKIFQIRGAFKFSLDSILLAEFVRIQNSKQVILDFCTGNAVIPLILSINFNNKIYGIEIQRKIYKLAKASVKYNNIANVVILNDNLINSKKYFSTQSIDIITCNPPFFKYSNSSIINCNLEKAIARHEITIKLEQIIETASFLLKNGGYFYLVHRCERLEEIISLFTKYNFKIKELQFCYTKKNCDATIVLIRALKNGKSSLKIKKPIYLDEIKTYQNLFYERERM